MAGASDLKGLVFLMIVLTVGLQGLTAPSLARRLGLVLEPEPLALAIDPLAGGASPAVGAPPDGVKEPTPQGESTKASP